MRAFASASMRLLLSQIGKPTDTRTDTGF